MEEDADGLYRAIVDMSNSGRVTRYGILYPAVLVQEVGSMVYQNGTWFVQSNGGRNIVEASDAQVDKLHRDIASDTVQVNLMSNWGDSGFDPRREYVEELHSGSGNSFAAFRPTPAKADAEQSTAPSNVNKPEPEALPPPATVENNPFLNIIKANSIRKEGNSWVVKDFDGLPDFGPRPAGVDIIPREDLPKGTEYVLVDQSFSGNPRPFYAFTPQGLVYDYERGFSGISPWRLSGSFAVSQTDGKSAPPPAMVETPPRAETPEMPPPVAAGELPGAENVTRTKKAKAKGFEAPVVVEAPAETPDVSQPLEQARALYAEFEPDRDMSAMAQTIAGLIEAKDADGLRRWVMHGRGFNDTTKKVVFRMIGKPVPSNREAIGRAIDEWFGVSAEARAEIERGAEAARRAEVEARKEEKRQENEAEWKASVQGKDTDRVVSYLLEMPALRRGSAISALNRLFRFDGVVRSRRAQVEHLIDGGAEVSTRTEPAVKPMTRTQYNRASNEQQEAHERRMREGGEKTVYLVGDYDIGKHAYDYALHLIAQREQSTAETPNPSKPADAVTAQGAQPPGSGTPGEVARQGADVAENAEGEGGGARFSPAEGEGGGVETAARAPAPGASSARRGTPQGVAGGKLNGKPRIGLRLGDVVELAVALANGKAPRVVERIRGLGGRAAGVFKPNADGTASIDIRADQALVVGTGERAALMAETSEQVQAELGERPGVEDAEGRANWDERAREVFKEKLDEAFARNVQDDPEQAMKVMAHEVGHWVDWLPDNTLKRGNVFGHIAALKGFLFGKLGLTPDQQLTAAQIEELRGRALKEAGGDSKKARSIFAKLKSKAEAGSEMARLPEVKAELEKLIAWYNNSETMPEYYREPAEMFADAFSAWVNYPAEVAARAPIFNSLVEEWIAARPEAYAHYAAIQKKLETPGMAEGEQVRKLEEGFERARRDAELAARARERVGGAELSDRVLAFFHRTMDPIYRRVARLKDTARAAETLKALADQRYWGAVAERITTKVGERVVKPLQAAGVSIWKFNVFLAMRRIANEGVNTMVDEQRKRGRANLFNPFGFTARAAGAWLKAHGEKFPESLAAMETAAGELVAIRREVLFPILKASGAVDEKTYEMLLENWAYAKFKVNQHGELKSALERMMGVGEGGSGLKTQRGTLREIGGPLENTVLADIAMARWALTQNANWRAIQDIMATTPEDV